MTTEGSGELKSSCFSMSSVCEDDDVRCGEVAMSKWAMDEERLEEIRWERIRWEEERRELEKKEGHSSDKIFFVIQRW